MEETIKCDRCGGSCEDGYEHRKIGSRSRETGYQDEEIVCIACLDEEAYAASDDAFTCAFEEGEI